MLLKGRKVGQGKGALYGVKKKLWWQDTVYNLCGRGFFFTSQTAYIKRSNAIANYKGPYLKQRCLASGFKTMYNQLNLLN